MDPGKDIVIRFDENTPISFSTSARIREEQLINRRLSHSMTWTSQIKDKIYCSPVLWKSTTGISILLKMSSNSHWSFICERRNGLESTLPAV